MVQLLRVQRIGYAHLENVGADALLFLSDVATKHWASNYNGGRASEPMNFQSPAATVRSTELDQLCGSTRILNQVVAAPQ